MTLSVLRGTPLEGIFLQAVVRTQVSAPLPPGGGLQGPVLQTDGSYQSGAIEEVALAKPTLQTRDLDFQTQVSKTERWQQELRDAIWALPLSDPDREELLLWAEAIRPIDVSLVPESMQQTCSEAVDPPQIETYSVL